MLAFPRAWRTCFLGLPARWLLSLHLTLAVLDVSSLGDLLSLSPEQGCLLCHCSPPLLGHRTQEPLFLQRPVLQHRWIFSSLFILGNRPHCFFSVFLSCLQACELVSYVFLCWGCSSIFTVYTCGCPLPAVLKDCAIWICCLTEELKKRSKA